MILNGLVSNYTVKQFKIHKATCNEDNIENKLNREFNRDKKLDVVVSDLTYVNVQWKWNYICVIIDEVLTTFNIDRSLSKKGCPYDNAVAEATYKIIKTEFAFNRIFESFEELEIDLYEYVNWYNNIRIHGSLNYLTPVEYKNIVNEENV